MWYNGYFVFLLVNFYVLFFGVVCFMSKNGVLGCVVIEKMVGEFVEEVKVKDKGCLV